MSNILLSPSIFGSQSSTKEALRFFYELNLNQIILYLLCHCLTANGFYLIMYHCSFFFTYLLIFPIRKKMESCHNVIMLSTYACFTKGSSVIWVRADQRCHFGKNKRCSLRLPKWRSRSNGEGQREMCTPS